MRLEKIYLYQLYVYLFIIVFAVQNYYLNQYNFEWNFYEYIVKSVFILSVLVIFGSLIFLTFGAIQTINKEGRTLNERIYLVVNLVCFYGLTWASIYLSGQMRWY